MSTSSTSKSATKSTTFTDQEKAAMKSRAAELKAEARANKDKAEGLHALMAAIAALHGTDRVLAERLHAIVQENAPSLSPKTWYGMPAYTRDGKVVCYFKSAEKFSTRYAQLGFEEAARLDDGAMWPTVYALTKLTAADETRIAALVKKAAG